MSDEIKNQDNQTESKDSQKDQSKVKAGNASVEKLSLVKKVKELSGEKWTLTQEAMQEVIATHTIANPGKPLPKFPELMQNLRTAIEEKYSEDPELKQLILDSIPNHQRPIKDWFKKEGWEEAVWNKIRDSGLFSKERRSAMIHALYMRGLEKDTVAAKIYLQMSGDFVEKSEVTNKDSTMDKFREINTVLHKKKTAE